MTFLEAALNILSREKRPLHFKELTERAMTKKLLTFVGRTPEVTMQTQLTAAVKKAPGNPFVRVKPGVFGLLRYPELPPEEPEVKAEKAEKAERTERTERAERAGAAPRAEAGEEGGRRRRRRRGGRGRGRDEAAGTSAGGTSEATSESAEAGEGGEDESETIAEPNVRGLSAAARAAALAETGVLEGDAEDGDEAAADAEGEDMAEGDEAHEGVHAAGEEHDEGRGRGQGQGLDAAFDESGAPAAAGEDEEGPGGLGDEDEDEDEGAEGAELGAGGAAGPAGEGARSEDLAGGRRRRRRRRRRGGGGEAYGEGRPGATGEGGTGAPSEGGAEGGAAAAAPEGERPAGEAAPEGEGQGPRRIMTPVDAAIEVLRGQAPGRGVHVRQIADAAARRRLVHGEPNEAWRVMRAALAAEPRERLRAGLRPRVRAAGAGLFALARRPPDAEVERAELVFGEARRALRERTLAALERRIADLPPPAFEALARVLIQREGFGPATFVKRIEQTIYIEALRGRGSRPSRVLIALRAGGTTAGRRAIGELRAGAMKRGQDEALLMLAGRLGDDAISDWKRPPVTTDDEGKALPTPPIEIADGQAMAETCIRHGLGVVNATVSVDFVDADFFAELAEG
jgi:hypothetical protein